MIPVLIAAVLPPAYASLMPWAERVRFGADMARRRTVRALVWAPASAGALIANAVAGLPWGILAASVNLAIGLVLLGRVAAQKARQS